MNVKITYNPYLLSIFGREKDSLTILVDEKEPYQNSSLIDLKGKRLQEWADRVPEYLCKEYNDTKINVEFTGTNEDFDDLKFAFDTYENENPNQNIEVKCKHSIQKDSADVVIKKIQEIFNDIQNSKYVPELGTEEIRRAFETALNMEFEVDVIATVSAGKSTLINALLGKKLLPMGNDPTTSTIVRIISSANEEYSAKVFYENDEFEEINDVDYSKMKSLNEKKYVKEIEICGKIPFAQSSTDMKLVLVDTPGPNSAWESNHKRKTDDLLDKSEKSLFLFVIDATHKDIEDEKVLLNDVSERMKEHGKQSRDRYIFAINQLDRFKVVDDGEDWVPNTLKGLRNKLEKEYGIKDPNLFPLTALTALEIRTNDEDCDTKNAFERKCKKLGDKVHFETYNKYSNLPDSIHKRIIENKDLKDKMEIYSGIVSIEEAIKLYIDKYAKTTKVGELIRIFKPKLDDKQAIEKIQTIINSNSNVSQVFDKRIKELQSIVVTKSPANELKTKIENINIRDKVETEFKEFDESFKKLNTEISRLIVDSHGKKVKTENVEQQHKNLKEKAENIIRNFDSVANKAIQKAYEESVEAVIKNYNELFKKLTLNIKSEELRFAYGASESLCELKKKLNFEENIHAGKSNYNSIIRMIKELFDRIFNIKREEVDLDVVVKDYFQPIQETLSNEKIRVLDYTEERTKKIKEILSSKIVEVEELLQVKMNELNAITTQKTQTDEEVERNKKALNWYEKIQKQIDEILWTEDHSLMQ